MKLARRPSAIIFDLDGTLLDTEPLYTVAAQQVVEQYGKDFSYELKARTLGGDAAFGAQLVIDELNLPLKAEDYLAQRSVILRQLFQHAPAMPGAEALVTTLAKAGAPIAVGTSSYRELVEIKWQDHGWLRAIESFVCGDDPKVGARKPRPDIFLEAARRLSQDPTECLVFEDSPAGVQAARAANMQVIALRAPEMPRQLLADADWVVDSYAEIDLSAIGW